MKFKFTLLIIACISILSCKEKPKPIKKENKATVIYEAIKPLRLDAATLSGLNLESVTNTKEPDRKLFQRNLYKGREISVYIVSSESASATHDSYGIDEFLYLINGGAMLKPKGGTEQNHYTGDFFIAPRGYVGEWETIGGTDFHHELSVISTRRNKNEIDPNKIQPFAIDKKKLSGIGITKIDAEKEIYQDVIYEGHELTIVLNAEAATQKEIRKPLKEQLIYVIAGSVTITDGNGKKQDFFAGDFFVLPAGFMGKWESKGHHLFRSMSVTKTAWK